MLQWKGGFPGMFLSREKECELVNIMCKCRCKSSCRNEENRIWNNRSLLTSQFGALVGHFSCFNVHSLISCWKRDSPEFSLGLERKPVHEYLLCQCKTFVKNEENGLWIFNRNLLLRKIDVLWQKFKRVSFNFHSFISVKRGSLDIFQEREYLMQDVSAKALVGRRKSAMNIQNNKAKLGYLKWVSFELINEFL